MTNLRLRPYQEECLQAINDASQKGITRQLVHLPTGAGKTVVFAHLIQQTKKKTLVIAHTNELLEQARDKIRMTCPSLDVGLINSTHKEFDSPVVVSSIQSARQPDTLRLLQQQGFSVLIYDECHHAASDSARMVIDSLGFGKGTNKLLTGFTATPHRTDSRGLGEDFDAVVYTKSIKSMIDEGYLCQPVGIKVATDLDLSKVQMDDGDYTALSLCKVMNTQEINDLVARTYLERAIGRKAICFGVSVSHAESLAACFRENGITARSVSGSMGADAREQILQQFRDGEIDVLVNCQILTEGFDSPAVDCVIVARPTQSRGLYQQMAGRGLRLYPNKKDCLILDFGDKNHTLCSTAVLLGDSEAAEQQECQESRMSALAQTLPSTINKKLRAAILSYDLLGDSFTWQKENSGYQLKGTGSKLLKIVWSHGELFDVIFVNGFSVQTVAQSLTFEFAFSTAEDFAKENRSHFIVSDLDASWRNDPISEKQKSIFRSKGFRAGIDDLTKGQASTIIASGILNRNAAQ